MQMTSKFPATPQKGERHDFRLASKLETAQLARNLENIPKYIDFSTDVVSEVITDS